MVYNTITMNTRRNILSPRMLNLVLVIYCLSLWKSFDDSTTNVVSAKPLNSIQLATGEWDVSIRGGFWTNPCTIFPPKLESIQPFTKRRLWGNSMDCVLSLASDGTFVLTPKYVVDSKHKLQDYTTSNHDFVETDDDEEENDTIKNSNSLLDLRGSWNVLANPYCVTDRYYDTISLTSYPRQEQSDNNSEAFQLILNCRMWGRHKRQKPRSYKMTHGTMVSKDRNLPWWKHFGRPIVASFSAVRSSKDPKHTGWIDRERFGYLMD